MNEITITNEILAKYYDFLDVNTNSFTSYKSALKCFFEWLKENNITKPTRQDIINYRSFLIGRNLKANTIKFKIQAIKNLFKYFEYLGIYKNITINIKTPKINAEYKHDILSLDQCKRLIENLKKDTSLKGLRNYAIITMLLTTGARVHEIANAKLNDIKIKNVQTVLYIISKGKTTKEDYLILTEETKEILYNYIKQKPKANEYLFNSISNRKSEKLSIQSINKIVKEEFKKIGLQSEMLTCHSLRHTSATLNLLNGATLEETKQFLRHSNINTTLIYTHLIEKEKANNEKRITNLIFN